MIVDKTWNEKFTIHNVTEIDYWLCMSQLHVHKYDNSDYTHIALHVSLVHYCVYNTIILTKWVQQEVHWGAQNPIIHNVSVPTCDWWYIHDYTT